MRRHSIIAALFVAACASPKPVEPPPAPPAEPQPVEASAPDGKELYGHVCVTCHGPRGDGKGLEQELFSFGSPETDWKHGATIDGVLVTLTIGVHETSMQPFPEYGDAERRAIAAYVLELRAALLAGSP